MSVLTTCSLDCPDRCSILARVEGETISLRGNPDDPRTLGFTCAKIRRHPTRLASPHRIREPWVRDGSGFRSAAWEEALELACEALERARGADPASILHVRGYGSMGVSKKFTEHVFARLGARSTAGSLCDAAGIAAIERDAGGLAMNDPRQLDGAEAVVLWGKHPKASSVHTAAQVARARKRGAEVLAVNPDAGVVTGLADHAVRVRPGTDRFLALACAKLLSEVSDRAPPWHRAGNGAAFQAFLSGLALGDLLAACGVGEEEVRRLAGVYGRSSRTATVVGWGVQRHPFGCENLRAVHALAFLAGTLGVPGGGLYYNLSSSRHFRKPAPPPSAPPEALGLPTVAEELARARPPIRVAWFTCSNLLNQAPDAKAVAEAFAAVETRVVVDAFWTETARRATVVLPSTLWLEEEDLAGSCWHPRVGAVRRVADPPRGCRTDFEIAAEVARRLGLDVPWRTVDDWLAACLPEGAGSLDAVRRAGGWEAPEPEVAWAEGFGHPDGLFQLLTAVSPEPPPDPIHPLRLLTVIRPEALNSQLLPEDQRGSLPVRLHPQTALRLGLESGSPVRVSSSHGDLEGEVHLDPGLHPEAVACPRGGWLSLGHGVNEVTEAAATDAGGGTAFYGTRVRVERVAGRGSP